MIHQLNLIQCVAVGLLGLAPAAWAGESAVNESAKPAAETATALFGGGCFWCTEAFFEQEDGVLDVVSGYAGGHVPNPTYKQVCTGETGHAEVIRIRYNPAKITYRKLLEIFFDTHDPTTLNRQGNDVGTQYRSVVFTFDPEQKREVETLIRERNASGKYSKPIVTEVADAPTFYPAENYHQDYFQNNPYAPYSMYIRSKLKKYEQSRKP